MYSLLAEIPVPTGAQFINTNGEHDTPVVEITYSVRDHVRNAKRTMTKSIVVPPNGGAVASLLQDVDIVGQALSPSGNKRALLRNLKGSKTARIIEIWNKGVLEAEMDVTEQHGDFYAHEYLSSLSFSSTESSILYVAEGKAPEAKNVFDKYRFNPDFGEGLDGKRRPTLYLFSWNKLSSTTFQNQGILTRLKTLDGVRFGQAIFSPNSDKIVYATGYEFTKDGRILGIKSCYNRPTGIWQLQLETEPEDAEEISTKAEKLTPSHLSCRSPRIVQHDGRSQLVWLSAPSGGAHIATQELYSLDITSDASTSLGGVEPQVHVAVVDTPGSDGFPGLYPTYNIPKDFLLASSTGPSILLRSQWGSRTVILDISLQGRINDVKNLTPQTAEDIFSWNVLATDSKSRFVCVRSSPSVPYEILLGEVDSAGSVSWRVIDRPTLPEFVSSALNTVRATIMPISGRGLVETVVILGKKTEDGTIPPCITSLHGGPHGTSSTAFSATTTALALEGYTISFPNYTGSPGFGETFLQDLVGKCGDLDVQDCIAAARHLVSIGVSEEGPGKQLITGGSHGGFLAAHLIGQFPTFFSAAIMCNPVTTCGEIANTDIPDWYYAEFGHPYPISSSHPIAADTQEQPKPNPPLLLTETFNALRIASPIAHVDSVCIPVLLLVGAADRRVSPMQGIEYYHALKARYAGGKDGKGKRKVEMLIFEGESHPMDGVEAAKAWFEAMKEWFGDAVANV
ncbi:hypothetical protein D9613_003766 [Agrocybe pediades]|uniref:acylaminoacyl-peptidase n=1 Tax=Agrocybe pediades TaxID=84607 RepID=A0A8H4QJB0_9AGAR|nr:hypothetical protein D9613_003766 [Agrocybe pediades]